MTAYYSTIRYIPNPISDEAINVGLVVFSGKDVEMTLTKDWSRAQVFARSSPAFLKSALDGLQELHRTGALTEPMIRKLAESWTHVVQLTAPRASTLDVPTLHEQVVSQVLRLPNSRDHHAGKRQVVRKAKDAIRAQLKKRFQVRASQVNTAIRSSFELEGVIKEHTLDLAVVNGVIQAGGLGLSCNQPSKAQLEREIDAVAFAIGDVRKAIRGKPLAVLAHTQDVEPKIVRRVESVFEKLDAEFVAERNIAPWSRRLVEGLPEGMFVR